jgi:1,4-dihydroxy-2-naphthoate octaprenyltransferase
MTKTKAWLQAFRLRTLPLSLSGIILGSFLAYAAGYWNVAIFTLSLITTLLFQILSNLANDLGDSQKGADNAERVGPARTVQAGLISLAEMKKAVIFFSILSAVSAAALLYIGTQDMPAQILGLYAGLAVLCILAAITYTIGKRAYGYSGFGDIFVFIFFGLVSVLGVYSLYTKSFDWQIIAPACMIGLLSTAVLNLNNMRDRTNDAKVGKRTMVVKIGPNAAKLYHALLILGALAGMTWFLFQQSKLVVFIALIPFIILLLHLRKVMVTTDPKEFDPELKKVALSTFGIAVLFTIGVLIGK